MRLSIAGCTLLASVLFCLPTGAQRAGVPNNGIYSDAPLGAHVISGLPRDAASQALQQAAIDEARAAQPAAALLERAQWTNLGQLARIDFQGHVLTDVAAEGPLDRILYAPSEADDALWRAALSAAAGGATVDYFDTRVATPTVAMMQTYDAVYTWANYAYFDNVGFGNNLAAYNDSGGTVVLGSFCTYTSGNFLAGAIMTPAYCPVVSPTGTNHFLSSTYAFDGTTCLYNGVNSLECVFRDILVTQGTGVLDGTYVDGEICHAYRPYPGGGKGDVVYSNGVGAFPLSGGGDWDYAVANASLCNVGGPAVTKILYAPSEADDPAWRTAMSSYAGGAVVDYFDTRVATPTLAFLQQYAFVYTWANYAYFNNVAFGDVLADYCDTGGNVVLGVFCTFTSGNFLAGRIMTPVYCPVVAPFGTNHYSLDVYAGNGITCVYDNVAALDSFYRDILVTQGGGKVDGTYMDGEICHAIQTFKPTPFAGNVVYSNGTGANPLLGGGQWAEAVVNSGLCIGVQALRNSAFPPLNAWAWLPDPIGPPSISRAVWMPLFDGTPAAWVPPLSPFATYFSGLFTGPANIASPFGGPDPWILGSLFPPNPIALQGPFMASPMLIPTPWPIPPNPVLVGLAFTTQDVVIDIMSAFPVRFTNAIDITIGT
jgi:hypothetical protein